MSFRLTNLPELSDLLYTTPLYAGLGFVYGYLFKVNPKVTAYAFVISEIARVVLFALANPLFGGDLTIKSLRVKLATQMLVNGLSIIAFRQFNIIATLGTSLLLTNEIVGFRRGISQLKHVRLLLDASQN